MPLQTENLVMIGLGVHGDVPPNPHQPALPDGIHLRWSFEQELGFPWFGFYLFRRPALIGDAASPGADLLCLSTATNGLQKGDWLDKILNTFRGRVSSDTNLVFTDDFPPSGNVEFDLEGRGYLRFELPPNEPAHRVVVQVGFRQSAGVAARAKKQVTCVNFTEFPPGIGPNPRIEQQVQFAVRSEPGTSQPTRIDLLSLPSGAITGLNCWLQLEITLPVPSLFVELTLSHSTTPPRFEAFNADGSSAGSVQLQTPRNQTETARIKGTAITRVVVYTPQFEVWLHNFCYGTKGGAASEIKINALLGDTVVSGTTVSGQPGQVVSASLEFDAITSVEISPGAGVLVNVCYTLVSRDATIGWGRVPEFPYPMCLPVTHPDYPCSGGAPINQAAAEALALSRVRYGLASNWAGASFASLHDTLLKLVSGGPAGVPMAARSEKVPADPSPDDGIHGPPGMPAQHPLDLVLLSTLHPPFAQMLGLYWVDDSAIPNQAYDYLIVADYKGIGGRNQNQILAIIKSSGFAQLEGYIIFNKQAAPAKPLTAPGDVRAYALPGGTFPAADQSLPVAQNNAGLRWDIGVSDDLEVLLPDKPIMYHVWRADLGDGKKPAQGGAHNLITKNRSVFVTEPRVRPGATIQRAADWPPFPLHFIDTLLPVINTLLPDGWYSYQVSGIDIFGRHSPNSNAADWYQWNPMPEPRPWYYQDPPGDTVIRQSAIRLLDKIPAPPPTGIEAHALDPADPTVVQDHWYETWRASLTKKERKRLIGLRVKWVWLRAHQRQAPDTHEFRIYFHPGSALPTPDHSVAINWQERFYVVAYDDPNALKAVGLDGTRFYEILLPTATDQFRDSLTLTPSLAEPVVYAHIGVSAADDKPHTLDAVKWASGHWGNRPGNEGRVGQQATIYRVLRTPPDPPVTPADSKKVFASKADYHDRSFYTYRWRPAAKLKTHIFRAMDDAVFNTDWSARPFGALTSSQSEIFPDPAIDPRWDAAKRQQVVDELNQLNSFAHDEAGKAAAFAYYRGLSNDALRILAGLTRDEARGIPGNERAFTQLTIQPLDLTGSPNLRGPDNDASFVVDPTLCAYVDTLDGRGSNRYFYRACYEDGAHNQSQLSLSGPPVYLPKINPPNSPVLTTIRGGERQIELRWVKSREADLAAYRVYRTSDAAKTSDIRRMERVQELSVTILDPNQSDASWTDKDAPAGLDFHYRVTALDSENPPNESAPSKVVVGRAVDTVPPTAPEWVSAEWVIYDVETTTTKPWPKSGVIPSPYQAAIRLELKTEADFLSIYRRVEGEKMWQTVAIPVNEASGHKVAFDLDVLPSQKVSYRAVASNQIGTTSQYSLVVAVEPK